MAAAADQRLGFIDALRASIVAFVIVHHAAQAYGPTGGFWLVQDSAQSDWFAPFYTANSAFGLGLLFLLAGYFVPGSYDSKGARDFLRGRWLRLGVPMLAWIGLIALPAGYLFGGRPPLLDYLRALYDAGWLPLYAHLWFLAHLLLYSAAYAVWRRARRSESRTPIQWAPPSTLVIAGFIAVLALITFVVRIVYAVDDWVPLFWIMPAEPAHLPQYVALFAVGIAARRNDWFLAMPRRTGLIWLGIGLVVVAGVYVAHLGGPLSELMATGGLSLSSLARSLWETTLVTGMSLGLVVAFREGIRRPSRLTSRLAAASFGAYLIHPPIVLVLQLAMLGAPLPVLMKFGVVAIAGIALSFGIAELARLLLFARRVRAA